VKVDSPANYNEQGDYLKRNIMNIEQQIIDISEAPNTTIRQRVDGLLELDRDVLDLGKGATREAIKMSKKYSLKIYKAINKLDKQTGKLLLNHLDG
tara:strand:+ start:360 stop:647 length:288 start_codon:yes stop_codon:yes gene_type:complete